MAGYATLKAARGNFAPLESYLDGVIGKGAYANVAEIVDIHYADAKRLMLHDLRVERGYNPALASDTALLDTLTDAQTDALQQALAYYQLAMLFLSLDNGSNSLNRDRLMYYEDKVAQVRRTFGSLSVETITSGTTTSSVRVSL